MVPLFNVALFAAALGCVFGSAIVSYRVDGHLAAIMSLLKGGHVEHAQALTNEVRKSLPTRNLEGNWRSLLP